MASKRLSQQQAKRIAERERLIIEQHEKSPSLPGFNKALVVGSFGHDVYVESNKGQAVLCKVRRDRTRPVCGDKVLWSPESNESGIIEAVFPRKTLLERPDSRGQMRTVAANVDCILVTIASKPAFNEGLLDRYLVAADLINVKAIIILNKIDLPASDELENIRRRLEIYKSLGYTVIETSTKQQAGIDELNKTLYEQTCILVGQSGVGKSSLVNVLFPGVEAETRLVSESTGKGKHTTTSTRLYHLPCGGHLIDSPGIREFGLVHASPEEVRHAYHEIDTAAQQCKFNDCQHTNEPGCAVQEKISKGEIDAGRFERYTRILETIDE